MRTNGVGRLTTFGLESICSNASSSQKWKDSRKEEHDTPVLRVVPLEARKEWNFLKKFSKSGLAGKFRGAKDNH